MAFKYKDLPKWNKEIAKLRKDGDVGWGMDTSALETNVIFQRVKDRTFHIYDYKTKEYKVGKITGIITKFSHRDSAWILKDPEDMCKELESVISRMNKHEKHLKKVIKYLRSKREAIVENNLIEGL